MNDRDVLDVGAAFFYHGSASAFRRATTGPPSAIRRAPSFGYSVGTAGDVNGDGYADVIVGAPDYDSGQTNEGRAFVVPRRRLGHGTPPADLDAPRATRLTPPSAPRSPRRGTSTATATPTSSSGRTTTTTARPTRGEPTSILGSARAHRPRRPGPRRATRPARTSAIPWPRRATSTATATPTSSSARMTTTTARPRGRGVRLPRLGSAVNLGVAGTLATPPGPPKRPGRRDFGCSVARRGRQRRRLRRRHRRGAVLRQRPRRRRRGFRLARLAQRDQQRL